MQSFFIQYEGRYCQSFGFLEGFLGCVGEVFQGLGFRDYEYVELVRSIDLGFLCFLFLSWQLFRNVYKYKIDFVFEMFWNIDFKGRIKVFLWGWLFIGENCVGVLFRLEYFRRCVYRMLRVCGVGVGWFSFCCLLIWEVFYKEDFCGFSESVFRGVLGWNVRGLCGFFWSLYLWGRGQFGVRFLFRKLQGEGFRQVGFYQVFVFRGFGFVI